MRPRLCGTELALQSLWRLVLSLAGLMGARLAGAAFGFLSQVMLARTFLPHDVGTVFLGMSLTAFVSLLITGGYHSIALTYLARFQAFGRSRLVEAFLTAARRDMYALAGLFLLLAPAAFVMPLDDGMAKAVLYGVLAAIPVAAIRLNNSAANAQRRFALSYMPDFVIRPGLLLGFLVVMILFGLPRSIDAVLIATVAIAVVVAVGQAIKMGSDNAFRRQSDGAPQRDLRAFYRRRAAAMLMVTIVAGATADLVVLLGGLFLPPDQVAVLGVAIRVAALVGFFSTASQQFALRDLATSMASNRSATSGILWRTNLIALATMLGTTGLAIVFGPLVLALFGPEYVAGYWPLVIFLFSQSVRVMGGMNAHLLSLGGHQVRSARLCLVAVVVLVTLAAVLTPAWGLVGIASALLVAEIFWAVSLGMLTQRLEGRRGDIFQGLATHRIFTAVR